VKTVVALRPKEGSTERGNVARNPKRNHELGSPLRSNCRAA